MYERFLREPVPRGASARASGSSGGSRSSTCGCRCGPLVRFVYAYVVRLGFLDGRPGLVFCTLLAFYDFLAWAKVYERRVAARRPSAASGGLAGAASGGDGRGLREHAAIERVQGVGLAGRIEPAGDPVAPAPAGLPGPLRVGQQGQDGLGQRVGVAGGDARGRPSRRAGGPPGPGRRRRPPGRRRPGPGPAAGPRSGPATSGRRRRAPSGTSRRRSGRR